MRICRDKTICVLRRSPVSIKKKYVACNLFAPYQQPAGFSQTYKDHLYLNDPYVQPWDVTRVNYEEVISQPESPRRVPQLPEAPPAPPEEYSPLNEGLSAPVPSPQFEEEAPVKPPIPTQTQPKVSPEEVRPVPPPVPEEQSSVGLIVPRL